MSLGLPGMPLVVLPHPTSTLGRAEAQCKAQAVVADIVDVLTQDATVLAAAYATRAYAAPQRTVLATPQLS